MERGAEGGGIVRCDAAREERSVKFYDFEVLKGEEVIGAERAVPLHNPGAAWPKVIKLARSLKQSGCRIAVKERGETIILVGAKAALRYSDFEFPAIF